jgi:serine/threonine protein kinase
MIDQRGYLKLIDFGTAKVVKGITNSIIGTPNFIAPELLQRVVSYSNSCDYWSIGVCLYYIYFGRLPFGAVALEIGDIFRDILYKDPEFPEGTNPDIQKLLNGLLKKQPSHRIKSFSAIQKESLFKDFPWDELIKYNIKPFYVPPLDVRDNPKFLNDLRNPFEEFMESEQFKTIQMQTLGINNTKVNRTNAGNSVNSQWFDDF